MTKAKDKVYDAAGSLKPYVDRAVNDEKLRTDVMHAYKTARDLYDELLGNRRPVTVATRMATDAEVRERLKEAVEDLRSAADRLQGKRDHSGRNATLLVAGIALGILFNPVTGPETRKWVKDLVLGGSDEFGESYPPSDRNGGG